MFNSVDSLVNVYYNNYINYGGFFMSFIKKFLLIVLSVLCVGNNSLAYSTKYSHINGKVCNQVCYYNKKSDILVIGASNVAQMYNAKCKASFVACWGGHYGYGTQNGKCYRIDSDYRINQAKKMIKKGKVKRVFIYATTNDWSHGSGYQNPIKCMVNCAKKLKNRGINVYCCSMIGMKGSYVGSYNSYLKKICTQNGVKYCNVRPNSVYYLSDGDHYQDKTVKAIFRKIKKYR